MNDPITSTPAPTRTGRRRGVTIGVAAGLLAGGAIGLVAGVPSLTSAASDDAASVVVALQEDTADATEAATQPSMGPGVISRGKTE